MADWNVCLNLVSKASISLLNDKRYGSSVKGKIKGKSFSRLPFSFAWFLEMDCLLINSSNSSSVILPCLLSTTRDFSCSSDASFTIKIDWMFVSSRTRYALHMAQYCCYKMTTTTTTTTTTCHIFSRHIIFNNYFTSVRWTWVGYNHLISNKCEWNNCFVKNAHKISWILPHFICKNNRFSAWLNFEQKRSVTIFGEHGIMAQSPSWLSQSEL